MIRKRSWLWVAVLGCAACAGCSQKKREALPMAFGLMGRPVTLAVAPAHDLTGTGHLDVLALTDLFASELSQVPQISVVPVNQVLAVMYGQGWRHLASPEQVLQLARLLNADGVVVLAVSEYDPYDPPRLGLITEVYVLPPRETMRLAGEEVGRAAAPVASRPSVPTAPTRQMQRVFEAARKSEQELIRKYAALRDPPGKHDWQEYLRSQKQFLRYCSWRTAMEICGAEVEGG